MFLSDGEKIVKRGICLYDHTAEYEVMIVESPIFYGTGDYEDPPDIADDREILCYYVWYDTPPFRGVFSAGGGGFFTIKDAVVDIESKTPVVWQD